MYNQEPTNFDVLAAEYADIILEVREGIVSTDGQTRKQSTMLRTNKTILFQDGSKMYVTELYKRQGYHDFIDYYHYDWYESDGVTLKLKFHSEPHSQQELQTMTEPYHIHALSGLGKGERLANQHHRTIHEIMEMIRLMSYIKS